MRRGWECSGRCVTKFVGALLKAAFPVFEKMSPAVAPGVQPSSVELPQRPSTARARDWPGVACFATKPLNFRFPPLNPEPISQ